MKNYKYNLNILPSKYNKDEFLILTDLVKYNSPNKIDNLDRLILRDLAKRLKEIAAFL